VQQNISNIDPKNETLASERRVIKYTKSNSVSVSVKALGECISATTALF